MKIRDFVDHYTKDSLAQTLVQYFNSDAPERIHIKGLVGSLDAVVASAAYKVHTEANNRINHLYVLHDRDEALYFYNDLQNLLGKKNIWFFPSSYKRPYKFMEVENANILERAEVLNRINQRISSPQVVSTDASKANEENPANQDGFMIVTYPSALVEKVINKRSLLENTFTAQVGEQVDIEFLAEILHTYDFDKTDFVYEAGQFSIRGGIVDIFSYSNDYPYRLEFFDDELESIRLFDPESQLSIEQVNQIAIIPNVQTKLVQEVRESFLNFVPGNTKVWFKDYDAALEVIRKSFTKVANNFKEILEKSGNTQIVNDPDVLFETQASFEEKLINFTTVEFGKRFHFKSNKKLEQQAKPQPSFNKDFALLIDDLKERQVQGYSNFIAADSLRQVERLHVIFDELDPNVKFDALGVSLREGFVDHLNRFVCYTDHQIFERFHRYRAGKKHSKTKALTLKALKALSPGDYVTHVDYGVGRFAGLEKVEANGKAQEAVRLVYRDDDLLYVSIHSLHKISKYSGKEAAPPKVHKLGSPEWETKKKRVKKRVLDIAEDLIELYAKRKSAPGFAFAKDSFLQAELESSFIYEDTPDQAKATADVKADMELTSPMDRLVCGDVGFGKTEVAIRAAFKAACDGKQVAILVPTTILALQHYKTFKDRLEQFPCNIEYINRFKTTKQIKETLKEVSEGKVDILIGTHRIVGKDVKFKNLGLLVIDEEQKFGVKTKEKLKEMRVNVDVLTLTATPIPRTLHFSLMGARDLSIIQTPPLNRQPVTTEQHTFNDEVIRDAISYELRRGGQVFFVHNRVKDIISIANNVLKLVPNAHVGVAHGQMEGPKLEKIMMKFIEGEYDVLISTNIIEAGLDVPNANTIIIDMAHTFGLADLHQMRGRVGRSNRKAYCYLLAPAASLLNVESRRRLTALEEFSDLGDGFKIAMRDLDIRGAGNLLGAEQSGFISDLGFEMYHKVLDDAIQELKETKFKELFESELAVREIKTDCVIETDLAILIPESYVTNITERLSLYTTLDNIKEVEDLEKFQQSIQDRFGTPPVEVSDLIETVKLRWEAERLGMTKLTLKNGTMKGYFNSENDDYFRSDTFGKIILYLQQNPKKTRLKEHKQKPIIIFAEVISIQQAISILSSVK